MTREFFWDFDGMLFDTYPHTAAAFCEALERCGRYIETDEALKYLKVTIRSAVEAFGLDEDEQALFYSLENDMDFQPCGVPFDGIPELLGFVFANGGKNYLYTHRDMLAVRYLEKYSLSHLFADFITRENGFSFKPCPDALEFMIKKHSLDKKSCMMLGDRSIDIGAGVSAGIKTCLFDESGTLAGVKADFYCRSISQIAETVKRELEL